MLHNVFSRIITISIFLLIMTVTVFADAVTIDLNSDTESQLPIELSGLVIKQITYSNNWLAIKITNETGAAITEKSSIEISAYDNDVLVDRRKRHFWEMENGETSIVTQYYSGSTVTRIVLDKVIVNNAVGEGISIQNIELQTIDGIETNKIPYYMGGLTITDIAITENGHFVSATVKNETGHPVSHSSTISYKYYGDTGAVLESHYREIQDLNVDESCKVNILVSKPDRDRVVFLEASIVDTSKEKTKKDAQVPEIQEVEKHYVKIRNNGDVNVRELPDADSQKVGVAKAKKVYEYRSIAKNGWYQIILDENTSGYISPKMASEFTY